MLIVREGGREGHVKGNVAHNQKKKVLKQLYKRRKIVFEITISVLPPPSNAAALMLPSTERIA